MGREPSFPPRAGRDPSTMADFDDDEEPWTAYFSNPIHAPPQLKDYVYQPKRRVATFKYLAQLCLVCPTGTPSGVSLYTRRSRLSLTAQS